MNDQGIVTSREHSYPRSGKQLLRDLFAAENPEQLIRSVPPQTLYLSIREIGLSSAIDVIELASIEQTRLLLDFDLWNRDTLNEENLFEWLALPEAASSETDSASGLKVLQKLVAAIDLRLVISLIAKFIEVKSFEDPTDQPPGPGFSTPDKGYTWIGVKLEDHDKNFSLTRLLAVLFETNADLFYQLLAAPAVSTESILIEEAYQDRTGRLEAEGMPSYEQACEICSILPLKLAVAAAAANNTSPQISDIQAIEPLVYSTHRLNPLSNLITQVVEHGLRGGIEQFMVELSRIMNGAIVRWGISIDEPESVRLLAAKVRGAINVGMELLAQQLPGTDLASVYDKNGLAFFFRLGLGPLMELRKIANKRLPQIEADNLELTTVAQLASRPFPGLPHFAINTQPSGNQLEPTEQAIEHLQQLESARSILQTKQTA